jgi:uncharacterized protein (TIGR00645 family)
MSARPLERLLFASRWLVAPLYGGLAVALALLLIVFVRKLFAAAAGVLHAEAEQMLLAVLSLIDLTLVANLLVMVMLAGYENIVSRLHLTARAQRPAWLDRLDAGGIEQKLLSSIIAICGIQLLGVFFEVPDVSDRALIWSTAIYGVFVLSALLMAWSDRIATRGARD